MKRFPTLRQPPSALAEQQALGWLTKLTGETLSSKQQADFAVWLSLDTSHRQLFDELVDIWELTGQLSPSALARIEASTEMEGNLEPVDLTNADPTSTRQLDSHANRREKPKAWRRAVSLASGATRGLKSHLPLAASALLAIALVWLSSIEDPNTQWLETGTGDYTQVVLTDGSRLHLNTSTRVRVAYTEQSRVLQLVKGELFIEVAKDAARPLTVATQTFSATAIGTAFGVAALAADGPAAEQAFVAVAHGEVIVRSSLTADYRARGDGRPLQQQSLVAGDKIVVGQGATYLGPVVPANQQIASWRAGQLVYQDVALHTLVADLNRYHPQQLVIQDPDLGKVRISAVLNSTDHQAAVAALCTSLGLRAEELSDSITLLAPNQTR